MHRYIFWILLALFSCKTRTIDPTTLPTGENYFPLRTGNYLIYQTTYKEKSLEGFSTREYELKELVRDSFFVGNEVFFSIERYARKNSMTPWPEQPDSVWSARISNNRAIKTENNQPFIKLVFPLKEGKAWDGNGLNTLGRDEYQMKKVGQSSQIGGVFYDKTVQVVQEEQTSNRILRDYRLETYAENVGLVFKQTEILNFDFNTLDTTSGFIFTQVLKEKNY